VPQHDNEKAVNFLTSSMELDIREVILMNFHC
jgi:hypothetical protein